MVIRRNSLRGNKNLAFIWLLIFTAVPLFAEKGYWQFKGERFIEADPSPVDPVVTYHVQASHMGNSISAVYSWPGHQSSASFSWTTNVDLERLTPGAKIAFSGTLTHSGDLAANAWITLQPYKIEPALSHPSAQFILVIMDNISNRIETKTGELLVPQGPLYPGKLMELRFEIYPNGEPSALYRTYGWMELEKRREP